MAKFLSKLSLLALTLSINCCFFSGCVDETTYVEQQKALCRAHHGEPYVYKNNLRYNSGLGVTCLEADK